MGWTTNRAKVAGLSRRRAPDDPDLANARRDLAAERLKDYVRRVIESAPPLTDAQRDTIAVLLRAPVTPTPANQSGTPVHRSARTFTQADVDRIVADRVARSKKKHQDRRTPNGSVGETGGAA